MFKLFSKKSESVAALAVQTAVPSQRKYSSDIEEIHHEFEIAGERLLEEALSIVKQTQSVNEEKINRLRNIGFKNVKEVSEGNAVIQKKKMNEELANLIQYYQRAYPLNKFITEDQVKIICEKYSLVCGDLSRYKGFVPDEKLKQIENFKLKDRDVEKYKMMATSSNTFLGHIGDNDLTKYGKDYLDRQRNGSFNYFYITAGNGTHNHLDRLITKECESKFDGQTFVRADLVPNDLQICAPLKDMDTTGLKLSGHRLIKHVPDPIVLQPVRGGFLILALWGPEASDPIVVNNINN